MRDKAKIQFARNLRRDQNPIEYRLWYFLRNRTFGDLKFRREYVIGPYIVDFCCIEKRLVIELDGGQHAERIQRAYDRKRTEYLKKEGYEVLRFWDNDVMQNTDAVLEAIGEAVRKSNASTLTLPSPSASRGRGKKAH